MQAPASPPRLLRKNLPLEAPLDSSLEDTNPLVPFNKKNSRIIRYRVLLPIACLFSGIIAIALTGGVFEPFQTLGLFPKFSALEVILPISMFICTLLVFHALGKDIHPLKRFGMAIIINAIFLYGLLDFIDLPATLIPHAIGVFLIIAVLCTWTPLYGKDILEWFRFKCLSKDNQRLQIIRDYCKANKVAESELTSPQKQQINKILAQKISNLEQNQYLTVEDENTASTSVSSQTRWQRIKNTLLSSTSANGIGWLNAFIANATGILFGGISFLSYTTDIHSMPLVAKLVIAVACYMAGFAAAAILTRKTVVQNFEKFRTTEEAAKPKNQKTRKIITLCAGIFALGFFGFNYLAGFTTLPNLSNLLDLNLDIPSWLNQSIGTTAGLLTLVCSFSFVYFFAIKAIPEDKDIGTALKDFIKNMEGKDILKLVLSLSAAGSMAFMIFDDMVLAPDSWLYHLPFTSNSSLDFTSALIIGTVVSLASFILLFLMAKGAWNLNAKLFETDSQAEISSLLGLDRKPTMGHTFGAIQMRTSDSRTSCPLIDLL